MASDPQAPDAAPDLIDRIAPTRRPAGSPVMHQRWANLLFLHWTLPAEQVARLLPPGLTLDTFEGRAYVGLVPFTMTGVRPVYLPPFPPISNFHETNVRTYVHCGGKDPGVWFFSLDAASAVAVRLARAWFKLPYYHARMRMTVGSDGVTDYTSERLGKTPASCSVRHAPAGEVYQAQPGTLDHFLLERYLLYAYKGGRLFRGQVHHTPYPAQRAKVLSLREDLLAVAGLAHEDTPPIAHYASEVRVLAYPLSEVAPGG